MKRVDWRAVRLRPETLERLRAACSTMGVSSPDALAERIINDALEHEDLIGPEPWGMSLEDASALMEKLP